MRDLKFRCWDTRNLRWVLNFFVSSSGKVFIDPKEELLVPRPYILPEPGERLLDEFTGLHDKNGREIYEGDILKTSYQYQNNTPEIRAAIVEWDDVNPCFVLHWINEKRTDWYEYDFVKCGMMELEIIGNIHENPELLPR